MPDDMEVVLDCMTLVSSASLALGTPWVAIYEAL